MITPEQFHTASAGRQYVHVRIFRGNGHRHRNGGRMFRIEGDYGIVIPDGHHHPEKVPLADMTFWKSRNQKSRKTVPHV